ncbi:hypothetical protein [Micromonospora sp. NBC_01813]|uniref:hypothetical protein n=1 Tax=Micromonospora sp. NBC_01813 TaxID=2975988 RepID=UPI002DDBAFDF|nr:hypothetical protein [Micromonospora sp. NBC_01813]WSA11127.1 hypothetical protein OG958_10340 [Micromonospora sp. NBC_01813]
MRHSFGTKALVATAAGAVTLLAFTGCGIGRGTGGPEVADPLAVAAVETVDLADFDFASDEYPGWRDGFAGRWPGRPGGGPRGAGGLRGAGLHGEMTVQTDDGPRTLVMQRGTVQAVDGTTITVESSDGFVLDWTCADECRVIDDGDEVELSSLDVDATVGVAGLRDGADLAARVVRQPKAE